MALRVDSTKAHGLVVSCRAAAGEPRSNVVASTHELSGSNSFWGSSLRCGAAHAAGLRTRRVLLCLSTGRGDELEYSRFRSVTLAPGAVTWNRQFEVKAVVRGCESLHCEAGVCYIPDRVMNRVVCASETRGDIVAMWEGVSAPHALCFDFIARRIVVMSEDKFARFEMLSHSLDGGEWERVLPHRFPTVRPIRQTHHRPFYGSNFSSQYGSFQAHDDGAAAYCCSVDPLVGEAVE